MSFKDELGHLVRTTDRSDGQVAVVDGFGQLRKLITSLEQLVVPEKLSDASALAEQLDKYAVHTALIGQVKAGKTALSNAVLGVDNLLPSDVNPWTSVVTSVHLNQTAPKNKTAVFKFFTREEWDGMVATGGRIAAMAKKVDMETEVEDMRSQIVDMQQRTKRRLGKNFDLLLNNQHAFSEYNSDVIRRYVCLGEEGVEQEKEGRFAEMTRSADLYSSCAYFDYPMTIVDTPGVNDPFLVREAVTLDSLGKSDICIIVLSAHQALSTSDLALMRILLNLKREQIVLFINRVDELQDPASQIVEIHQGICETLQRQKLPVDIPVVYGSAAWAEAALAGDLEDLPDGSLDALYALIESVNNAREGAPVRTLVDINDLSGMSGLQSVLERKAVEGLCAPFLTDVAISASNIALQSRATLARSVKEDVPVRNHIDIVSIEKSVDALISQVDALVRQVKEHAFKEITFEISGKFREFIFHESRSLTSFVSGSENIANWECDSESLRRDLNEAYTRVTTEMAKKLAGIFQVVYKRLVRVYESISDQSHQEFGLSRPNYPAPGTPISLMRTMSFDMSESWVSAWVIRRLKKNAYAERFSALALEQMHDVLSEVQETHVTQYCDQAQVALNKFVTSHLKSIQKLADFDNEEARLQAVEAYSKSGPIEQRVARLSALKEQFEEVIEDLNALVGESRSKSA